MKPTLTRPLLLALTTLSLLGPWNTAGAILDKTRFVADLGIGFFAFHHWVLKPYEQGRFAAGAPGRVGSMVKGGLALLFAVHELRAAEHIAQTSHDPLLEKLQAGITDLERRFSTVGGSLRRGDASGVDSLSGAATTFSNQALESGTSIQDVPSTIPGL